MVQIDRQFAMTLLRQRTSRVVTVDLLTPPLWLARTSVFMKGTPASTYRC